MSADLKQVWDFVLWFGVFFVVGVVAGRLLEWRERKRRGRGR